MRVGIFGGTFDPIHYGHLLLAESCRCQLQLDQVRMLPAGTPPHKPDQQITDGHARADMIELAVSGYPEFVVDRREVRRGGRSFTVDTLQEFHNERTDAELYFLMGADSLRDLADWREPERIAELATIVAVNRPGLPLPTESEIGGWVGVRIAARVITVSMPGTDISATALRTRVREGNNLRFLTPRSVSCYIEQHRLYSNDQ